MKAHGLQQRESACETRTCKFNISCSKSGVFNRSQISSVTGWLAVASLAALLISCAPKPENAIVGKWSNIGGTETMEFLKDGTIVTVTEIKELDIYDPARIRKIPTPSGYKFVPTPGVYKFKKITKAGDYKFIEKDRIKLQWGGLDALDGPTVANISISDDELTFTMPDGRVKKYQRTK